jgi:GxxExxY protein
LKGKREFLFIIKNHVVGDFGSDLIVDNLVICELKANEILVSDNEFQLINYLKATDIEVGLLLNFKKA